ncbi:MAG: M24 family metallopeptidase [bacterium JZ-2024 1]
MKTVTSAGRGRASKRRSDIYESRRRGLFRDRELKNAGADTLLVRSPFNRYYLTGFWGSEGVLLAREDTSVLIVDSRYEEMAADVRSSSLKVLSVSSAQRLLSFLAETIRAEGCERIAFEAHLVSVSDAEQYRVSVPKASWVPVSGVVERLRLTKSEAELDHLRAASRVMTQVLEEAWSWLREGVTEKEIADEIEMRVRQSGAEKTAFDTIVLFGENTSRPHGHPGGRKLRKGDVVTIDAGAIVEHYCTDITRTIYFGSKPPDDVHTVYKIVNESQRRGVDAISSGKKCKEVDHASRGFIKRKGFGERFGHGLGHGVGLEIHEAPRLSQYSEDTLGLNMVVTVEPGIYLPGQFGVRIEDTVCVQKDGAENLTGALCKDLLL